MTYLTPKERKLAQIMEYTDKDEAHEALTELGIPEDEIPELLERLPKVIDFVEQEERWRNRK